VLEIVTFAGVKVCEPAVGRIRHMAQTPLDPKVKRRIAELIALGLTHKEVAGATGVSPKSVERTLADLEHRKIMEDAKQGRVTVAASVVSVIKELLEATNQDGTPNLLLREKGAALALKHPGYLEAAEDESSEELLPEGVILLYPVPPGVLEDEDEGEEPRSLKEPAGTGAGRRRLRSIRWRSPVPRCERTRSVSTGVC
jgi:hypothetical protein